MKKALAALLSASLVLSTPWAQAQVRLPALGDSASEDLPVGAERRLGEQIMREVKRDPAYLDDPVLLDYVRSLWAPLLQAARARGDIGPEIEQAFAWNLFLVQDRSVNAFALPGGHVGVHLGLMAVTATRDELAAVLAHELSHVTQRHIARSMGSASRQGALGLAAMLLGVLIAARSSNPDAAQAAIAGGQAAMIQGQLNFSRDMEREADRIGFGVFSDAGFAAPGMAAMFDKLDQASRLNDSGGFPYLRSHPLTSERMAEARSRLSDQALGTGAGRDTLHELMQARARALMDPTVDHWRRLVAQAQQAPVAASAGAAPSASGTAAGRSGALQAGTPYAGTLYVGTLYVGTLYAGALAAARLGDHRTAAALAEDLARALNADATGARMPPPGDTSAAALNAVRIQRVRHLLEAELALSRGDAQAAVTAMTAMTALPPLPSASSSPSTGGLTSLAAEGDARTPLPRERAPLLLRSQATLAAASQARAQGDRSNDRALREALEALQTWVSEHRDDAPAWLLLAQASDALGLQLRALRAQAEARAAVGDLGAAIDRLRAAQAHSRTAQGSADFIEASIIDTRLRELQTLRRQEMNEMRSQRGGSGPREPLIEDAREQAQNATFGLPR
ncbi:MAG: M48 family metalloprotease [Betaproteobacteria bacterium]